MKKCVRVLAAMLAVLTMVSLSGCTSREEADGLRTIDVCEVTHSVFYAPQYVAMSQGFFAEEGLSVELTVGQGADKVMAAVLSGSVDIGLAGPEAAIYVMGEGREDYPQGSHPLPGRTGGVPYMTLEYVVREHGLSPGEDVLFDDSVDFSLMASAFAAGTGDYVTIFEPTASAMEMQGQGYILASVGEASGEVPFTAYFAAGSKIEEDPELFEGFTRAVYRGQKWVEEHSAEEVAAVLQPFFAETDLEVQVSVVENYKAIDAWAHTPVMSRPGFEKLQDIMQQAGQLEERVAYDDLVNTEFAERVTAEEA